MPSSPRSARAADLLIAAAVAAIAFAIYHATLLPGLDFGDTGAFQTMAGSRFITPRDAYPLYFLLADAVAVVIGGDAVRAVNLASAIEGAVACGLMVLVGAELSGSVAAAAASALLFAVSYTFWSQAIIAEVYALHVLFVALTLLLLLRWTDRPSTARLTAFLAAYALGFGNHLSMILLAPGFAIALGPSLRSRRALALGIACAAAGALQYAWNIRTLWFLPQPPHGLGEAVQRFWFDVTKSDWRDTMVMNVPESMLRDHAAMYWFDLRQQFGLAGPLVAAIGLAHLTAVHSRRALFMAALFAANLAFAFSYNVGDAHVFYLPSHAILALLMPCGIVAMSRLTPSAVPVAATAMALFAAARGARDFPALDRSGDVRPREVLRTLTAGVEDQHAVLLTDVNWQIQNGLSVYARFERPELAVVRMPDVSLYLPALVADNREIGRSLLATDRAAAEARKAFGPLLTIVPDASVSAPSIADVAASIRAGTRYVLCVLKPSRDLGLDQDDLSRALATLTGRSPALPAGDYAALAGVTGASPLLAEGSNLPFTKTVQLNGVTVDVRMESWLAADTIRRMGFGHVVAGRRHTLIVERGVSFVAFDEQGQPIRTAYASNIFAPQRRFVIR